MVPDWVSKNINIIKKKTPGSYEKTTVKELPYYLQTLNSGLTTYEYPVLEQKIKKCISFCNLFDKYINNRITQKNV